MRKVFATEVIVLVSFWTISNPAFGQSITATRPANQAVVEAAPAASTEEYDIKTLYRKLQEQERRIAQQDRQIADLRADQSNDSAKTQKIQREEILKVLNEWQADAKNRSPQPAWLENLKFGGDFRLRYHHDGYDWGNNAANDRKDRNRIRDRLRFGFVKTWLDDQLEVGFRLASGNDNNPSTENQTLGESSGGERPFAKRNIWIDQAYARYSPSYIKGFQVTAGKFASPWITNDTFVSADVNPEGLWVEYKAPNLGAFEPFVGAGYFFLNERAGTETNPTSAHDSTLWAFQGGLKWKIDKDVSNTAGAYFHRYENYEGSNAVALGNDSPLNRVDGFQIIGVAEKLDLLIGKLPVSIWGEWAYNAGANDRYANYSYANNAIAGGVSLGQNKKQGDWAFKYRYAYIQANAIPGQFVDSTWGSTNRQGHVFGPSYNILDNLTVAGNVYITEPIFTPTTASGSGSYENHTVSFLADLVWKF